MSARRASLAGLLAALAAFAPPAAGWESSVRCDGGIVSVGDLRLDLLGKCGRPAWVEARDESRMTSLPLGESRVATEIVEAVVTVEQWTYDFGPNRLMQRVRFVAGQVDSIVTLGKGTSEY